MNAEQKASDFTPSKIDVEFDTQGILTLPFEGQIEVGHTVVTAAVKTGWLG